MNTEDLDIFRPQMMGGVSGTSKSHKNDCNGDKQEEWDEHLPFISMAHWSTPHELTGFSPNLEKCHVSEKAVQLDNI